MEIGKVKDLVELLLKCPQDNLLLANISEYAESVEITDVLVGKGTTKGFTYIKIDAPNENIIKLPCKVGDTVYADISRDGKGNFIDECIISEITFDKDYKEPLFTALCYEKGEYQRYWLSDFEKEVFLIPQFSKSKRK